MNILIILGHPDSTSFNHALADTCKTQIVHNGHSVILHDLYQEQFNPVYNPNVESGDELIEKHCSDLVNSDGIIIIHPNWWGQPPAIVKGWIDRVLLPNVAYNFKENDSGEHIPVGLLQAQIALVLNTSNTPEHLETELYKDHLETIWKNRVFNFCGVSQFERRHFRVMKDSDLHQRTLWLSEVRSIIDSYFPRIN